MNSPRPMIRPIGPGATPQAHGHAHHAHGAHGAHPAPQPTPVDADDAALVDPLAANSAHLSADEPLTLVEDASVDAVAEHQKKIRSYDESARHRHHDFKREVHTTGTGATRIKSFHGKYSDQGLAFMDDTINEWLDNHPEVDVKFVTSTVGMFDGKIKENALVLNLWY